MPRLHPARPYLLAAILAAMATAPAFAQPAYMVADLGDEVPYNYDFWLGPLNRHLEVGGKFYFYEDDGIHGVELWRSDGTALGTYMIRDLCPGSCGTRYTSFNSMAALGDQLVFTANDGVHGMELWITDGSALGTRLIADLRPGFDSSYIRAMASAADQVFFVAEFAEGRDSLWRTDGTAKGTYPILPPGSVESFSPSSIHPGPGFLYLCNASWDGQEGLWRSDGSTTGTVFVAPVGCWQNSIDKWATMLVGPDGVLYFQGNELDPSDVELWRSDGSLAGTYRLKDIAPGTAGSWPSNLVWRQGEIVFQASGASGNRELWRTNGTEAGTEMIPLSDGAQPSTQRTGWALAGDNYYFAAGDPDHGEEPWVYDGAVAKRVADVAPGAPSSILFSYPDVRFPYFESFGSQLIFVASDGIHGNEVWRTDGTEEETVRISDIAPGSDGIQLPVYWGHYRSSLGGRPLFIEHQPGTGERLWRVDPSGSSMELVDVLNFQTPLFETRGTDRFSLTEPERGRDCFEGVGSRLFFERTRLDQGGVDLLRTDGSLSGPEEILAGVPWGGGGPCGSVGESLLYSAVFDEQGDRELLSIHSLTNETELLMGSGARIDSLPPFLESNDARIFVASASLLLTDGTPEGTAALAGGLGEYGGRIDFFQGEVALADDSLWITDGAEPGGARLLFEGDYASMVTDRDLAPLQDTIVFAAWDPDHGSELWTSDGTAEGTGLLVDANPGNDSLLRGVSADRYFELRKPRMLAAGTYAVLAGVSAAHGEELWVTDGTPLGTGLLRDIYPGDYPSTPRNFTRFGDRIFFTAESELEGLELWVTDGTYDGTVLFKDIAPGGVSSIPDDLVVRDGILYFSAWTPTHGREAWKSDGTPGGTVRITDIAPGPLSSSPQRFARAGNRLFFSATDQIHGYELWAISDDGSIPIFLDGFETADTGRWSDTAP